MSTTNQFSAVSFGVYIVDLFKVDTDPFKLPAKTVHPDPTHDEYLNRPYDLSDLIRHATAAGVWPMQIQRFETFCNWLHLRAATNNDLAGTIRENFRLHLLCFRKSARNLRLPRAYRRS